VTELTTDRLHLRGWRGDDLDDLAAMNADPDVMRFILDGSVRDREQSAEGLRKMMRDWAANGLGLFAVEPSSTVVPEHEQPVAVHAVTRDQCLDRRGHRRPS
jgi:RimJ/RimL family protein N-acetyltransferase